MKQILREIRALANAITTREMGYQMRVRLNPHHSDEDQVYEKKEFNKCQFADFGRLKSLYLLHREELLKRDDITKDDLGIFKGLDRCVDQDLERELLTDV